MAALVCALCGDSILAKNVADHWRTCDAVDRPTLDSAGSAVAVAANPYIKVWCPYCNKKYKNFSVAFTKHLALCKPVADLETLDRREKVDDDDTQIIMVDPVTLNTLTYAPGSLPDLPSATSQSWLLRTKFQ